MNAPADVDHETLAATMPLEAINVADPALYQQDVWQYYFRRLRRDDPVHYCAESLAGPYWSVTKHKDIIDVEVNHRVFSSSSALGGITIMDRPIELELPMFIAMDPPKHDAQRKVVQPIVAPDNLANIGARDPRPRANNPRWPAARRDVQLGGARVDRADDANAGDAVRLSFEDRRQAHVLVGCRDRQPARGRLIEL